MTFINQTDVVILCGGLGTRLRSISGQTPKVMMEMGKRPFLDIILEHIQKQDLRRVVLLTGYQAYSVEEYYRKNDFDLEIAFSREEEPLGTGGALKNARQKIKSDPFFLLNGDSFCPVSFNDLLKFHRANQAFGTLTVAQAGETKDYGSIKMDKNKRITTFLEKGRLRDKVYVNAGIYCLSQAVFSAMPDDKKFSLEVDCFQRWVNRELYGYFVKQKFMDIGTPERYRYARSFLKPKK